QVSGIGVDAAGNVYVAGSTLGSLGGASAGWYDAFVAKYDAGGAALWTRQFGSSAHDHVNGVRGGAGGGSVRRRGTARRVGGASAGGGGGAGGGLAGAWGGRCAAGGPALGPRQFGGAAPEPATGFSAAASDGSVYIAGSAFGSLGGNPSAGGYDAFITKYDAA